MRARVASVLLALILVACGGIPLMSVPKLIALQGKVLDANPGEFMIAIQADTRLTPPPGSSPTLDLAITPRDVGAFPPVEKQLRMQVTNWSLNLKGLAPAPANRRWFVYGFTPESQAELQRIQAEFKKIRGQGKGGTVRLGISQEGVAARNPELANTKWDSWLQASKEDGFFEVWSGTLGELIARAGPQ